MKFDSLYELAISNLLLEGVTYQAPTDPSKLMADFYMLDYISSIDFKDKAAPTAGNLQGIPSAVRLDDFKEDVEYAKKLLYPLLKNILLRDTWKALACEGYYALNILSRDDEFRKIVPEEIYPGDNTWIKQLQKILKKVADDEEDDDTYAKRFTTTFKFLKENNISVYDYVYMIYKAFDNEEVWEASPGYGGKAWAEIAKTWMKLYKTPNYDLSGLSVLIDRIYDLEHNNGTVFNKIKKLERTEDSKHFYKDETIKNLDRSVYGVYGWISELLDYKAAIRNPYDLIDRTSNLMKKLASPVLKAAGWSRKTMQDLDQQYHYKRSDTGYGKEYWTDRQGRYNRKDGPAIISYDTNNRKISEDWFSHGIQHRLDGPASKQYSYEQHGFDTSKYYIDEPHVFSITYMVNNKLHRTDGPAYIFISKERGKDITRKEEYYLNGVKFNSKQQFEKYLKEPAINLNNLKLENDVETFLNRLIADIDSNIYDQKDANFNKALVKSNLDPLESDYPIIKNPQVNNYIIKVALFLMKEYFKINLSPDSNIYTKIHNDMTFIHLKNFILKTIKESAGIHNNDSATG